MPEEIVVPELTPEQIEEAEARNVVQAKRDRVTRFMKMRVGPVYDKMYEDGMTLDDLIAWIEGCANSSLRIELRQVAEKARRAGAATDSETVKDILAEE